MGPEKEKIWPQVYAVRHKDDNVRMSSRSGGIFTALSDIVLENKGVVYGCVLNDEFQAEHFRAETRQERDRMRGSKYIQSNVGDTFGAVKKDLNNGKQVLFSGTSCQIAGLKLYLKRDYDNLLCIDIVCHGVASPLIWKKYLEWQKEKNKDYISAVDFRNKKEFGWRAHVESLAFHSGKVLHSKIFTSMFYEHSALRPCCFRCPFKSVMHPGDITIADYWGIEKAAPEFDDDKGVSLVLVNNTKGTEWFDLCKNTVVWKETCLKDSMQPPLERPFDEPADREKFWSDYYNLSFERFLKKHGGQELQPIMIKILRKVKRKLTTYFKRVVK